MTAPYRQLPGKKRGFVNVASVWAGRDHLLLVRGDRFREQYKRFYYRDVQAIVVAREPRFHVSTRLAFTAAALAAALLVVYLGSILTGYKGPLLFGLGGLAIALAGLWVYVSAAQSCRCRLYTAVSADELPSVYRMWTARKFLTAVESLIYQTQGTIDGEWALAAEERAVGPVREAATHAAAEAQQMAGLPKRGLTSDLFLASLLLDGAAKIVPLPPNVAVWLPFAMEMASVVAAVTVIVQYNRGRLRTGMHRLAVASLIAFGTLYYVHSMSAGVTAGLNAAKTKKRVVAQLFRPSQALQQVGAGFDAILLLVGIILSLRRDEERRSGLLG